jgi:hypothetical protein
MLHELLEGRLRVQQFVGFRPHPRPFLRVFAELDFGAGFVGGDDSFGGFVLRLRPHALLVAIFEVVDELELRLLAEGSQLLEGVPLRLLLHTR